MRALILMLFVTASLIGADVAPSGDGDESAPKKVTAEESAKILAELKAKKAAKDAAKDPAEAQRQQEDMQKHVANKDQEAQEAKVAGAKRRAEENERKAIGFAKKAVADARQFMTRAAAEKKGYSERDIYRDKVVLHESGGTNQSVRDDVEKVTEFIAKANEARLIAGLAPIEMTVDRRGKQRDVVDWIIANGR